jgi:uncharacterized protein YndB with AHSA1/START domain
MSAAISTQEITITRRFDAPRELVWKAWTEPDQLAQWWGPPGWTNRLETLTMDVRPGGAFRITSVSDEDGTEMTTSGAYREVLEPERLVLEEPAEDAWHENAVSVVTLTDLGDGRTQIVLHATIQTTDERRAHAEAGMMASLDRLAEHLA